MSIAAIQAVLWVWAFIAAIIFAIAAVPHPKLPLNWMQRSIMLMTVLNMVIAAVMVLRELRYH